MLITKENEQEIINSFSEEVKKNYKSYKGGEGILHKIEKLYAGDMFLKQGYTILFEKKIPRKSQYNNYYNVIDLLVEKNEKKHVVECVSFQGYTRYIHFVLFFDYVVQRYLFILEKVKEQETNKISKNWFLVVPEIIGFYKDYEHSEFIKNILEEVQRLSIIFNFQLIVVPYHIYYNLCQIESYKFEK